MASQEHLRRLSMLHGDDDSTTTSSGDDDDETSSENGDEPIISLSRRADTSSTNSLKSSSPHTKASDHETKKRDSTTSISSAGTGKKRIKLSLSGKFKISTQVPSGAGGSKSTSNDGGKSSLPKTGGSRRVLPIKKQKAKPKIVSAPSKKVSSKSSEEVEISAMVVDSDDGGEDDAVAAVVEEAPTAASTSTSNNETSQKKRPTNVVKAVRFPPMPSPGLLIPPTSGSFRGAADQNGFSTPASVFDHAMSLAGYTTEERTNQPHRGSSIKREVGDMFDRDVKFSLHFPRLVPEELLLPKPSSGVNAEDVSNGNHLEQESLPERLIKAFQVPSDNEQSVENGSANGAANGSQSKKRRKMFKATDMVPLSLTMPYPEQFLKKRLEYVEKVQEREKAIVQYQEMEEALEIEHEKKELNRETTSELAPKPDIVIPPIPEPPSPPRLADLKKLDPEKFDDQHPLYMPKGNSMFVEHLDKSCFHIVNGRYFGLLTTSIADPLFVGPNAPGVTGLHLSAATTLSTAQTGSGGSSGGGALLSAPTQSAVSSSSNSISGGNKTSGAATSKANSKKAGNPKSSSGGAGGQSKEVSGKDKGNGPKVTSSMSDLRKIMEEGGELADKIKTCIIRAAVHASRSGKHGQNFRAPNGETYPDVSKAFAAHAGLKPCNRCKNNKQGAYHCRLRRKHKELDYDGSDSPSILAPLFEMPMEELLLRSKKKKKSS